MHAVGACDGATAAKGRGGQVWASDGVGGLAAAGVRNAIRAYAALVTEAEQCLTSGMGSGAARSKLDQRFHPTLDSNTYSTYASERT
jgi:hypothetical protein